MRNIRIVAAVACAAIAGCATPSAHLGLNLPMAASPVAVGLDAARLDAIEAVTRQHVESGKLPGAVMLVARRGQVAWLRSVGYRDRAAQDPMRPDAIFRVYSMTKPIVSVATMMLVEEGRIRLEDPVSRYLPEIGAMKVGLEREGRLELVAPEREMTVLDLLRHTSGLIYASRGTSLVNKAYGGSGILSRDLANREQARRMAKVPLRFSPGTRWEYGVSTDLLGAVVEVVAGEPLGAHLERRILGPLGMHDTAFFIPPEKLARAAQPWQRPGGPPMTPRFDVAQRPAFESGGGGLVSTMRDYLRFATFLLNGGELEGTRLLKAETVALMTRDHLEGAKGTQPGRGFGLGFEVRTHRGEPGKVGFTGEIGEYGWAGNAGTLFFIDPARSLVGIYLVQVSDEDRVALRNEFRSMVHAAARD